MTSVTRYQQAYGASALSPLLGSRISGIAFRVEECGLYCNDIAGGYVYDGLMISLSTSASAVDNLSSDLDRNVGLNETVVYNGSYVMPDLEGEQLLNPFDFRIDFSTPFLYTGGDLLLDISLAGLEHPFFALDAELGSGPDAISRVFIDNGSVFQDSGGLVTQFTAAVPVPAALWLFAFGLGLMGAGIKRRR